MPNFWRTGAPIILKIQWFPLSILIFGQKSCFLGPTIFKIPQPNWHYYVHTMNYQILLACIHLYFLYLNRETRRLRRNKYFQDQMRGSRPLSICTWSLKKSLKNLIFLSTSNLNFAGYSGSKNQVQTRKKIKFDSKSILFSSL